MEKLIIAESGVISIMMKWLVILEMLLLLPGTAKADNGFLLLAECRALLNNDRASMGPIKLPLYSGCVAGIITAFGGDNGVIRRVCYKPTDTPSPNLDFELANLVVRYLEKNPNYLSMDYFELVRAIFSEVYHCLWKEKIAHFLTTIRQR